VIGATTTGTERLNAWPQDEAVQPVPVRLTVIAPEGVPAATSTSSDASSSWTVTPAAAPLSELASIEVIDASGDGSTTSPIDPDSTLSWVAVRLSGPVGVGAEPAELDVDVEVEPGALVDELCGVVTVVEPCTPDRDLGIVTAAATRQFLAGAKRPRRPA